MASAMWMEQFYCKTEQLEETKLSDFFLETIIYELYLSGSSVVVNQLHQLRYNAIQQFRL